MWNIESFLQVLKKKTWDMDRGIFCSHPSVIKQKEIKERHFINKIPHTEYKPNKLTI